MTSKPTRQFFLAYLRGRSKATNIDSHALGQDTFRNSTFLHDQPIMIAREGYPVETHTVVTEDCYILEMHRIPHGKNNAPTGPGDVRPAVYLQHGLLCSSADWVMGIPEKSLGECTMAWI